MGKRMRQEESQTRAQRRWEDAEREWREERAEREGEGTGERPLSRSWWRLLAGLTARERLEVIQALEEGMRLVAERMERGLSEGQAGLWLVDEVRAWALRMAAVGGAAEGRPAMGERMARGGRDGMLTRRELEVLGLAAQGMKGPAIARALALSKDTVHTHQTRTCAKLGVSGTAAAVAKARELGLI